MTAKTIAEFIAATSRPPRDDDMERVNCVEAGQVGHFGCGWCKHDLPVFFCSDCFTERCRSGDVQFAAKEAL